MEISSSVALFAAIGTQIVSSLGLFWAVTSSFNNRINEVENRLSREINEVKVEQAKIEGRLNTMEAKFGMLEQTVRYILDCFPKPKIAIQNPQDTQ